MQRLTARGLASLIKQRHAAIVVITNPGCPPCQRLAPIMEQVHGERVPNTAVVSVDASKHNVALKKMDLLEFDSRTPTIYIFPGDGHPMVKYEGERTAVAIRTAAIDEILRYPAANTANPSTPKTVSAGGGGAVSRKRRPKTHGPGAAAAQRGTRVAPVGCTEAENAAHVARRAYVQANSGASWQKALNAVLRDPRQARG